MKRDFTSELDDALSQFIASASEAKMNEAFENAHFNVYRNSIYSFAECFSDFSSVAASSTIAVSLEILNPYMVAESITKQHDVDRPTDNVGLALAA